MPTTHDTRIAVIGAGPGGLTCARVLQKHGIRVTVYDADASRASRDQGGTLDMHHDSGQVALRAAGLLEDFLALSRPEGQRIRLLDQNGTVLFDARPGPADRDNPEIDRGRLRDLLLGSLASGTVRWGHKATHLAPLGGGVHRIHFDDGRHADADLVIGADGAWSRVRAALTSAVPGYTGVTFVEARFDEVDDRHPRIAALTGEGTMMALYANRGLVAQRNSGRHVRVYIAMRIHHDWYRSADVDLNDTQAVRAVLLGEFTGWAPSLLALITDNDGPYTNRPLYALPVPHTWEHTPGLTLLGDAAHLMSPFSGQGANLAMLDGADLAHAIATRQDLGRAVRAYENLMLPRSALAARGAAEGVASAISPDAPAGALAHWTAHH